MIRRPFARPLLASAALVVAVALAGCQTDGSSPSNTKAMQPLSAQMVAEIDSKGMDKESPILIRLFKEESELEVWKKDRSGRFALLKTYPICRWSGELGPKIKEGDRQAPEGFYTITPGQMNPNSQYYLSFDLGYPNAFDRAHGRTGKHLMVHGDCSSAGCYSMTDEQVAEIYALGREAFFGGQRSFQVQAYPFRMTAENMARHRKNPHIAFWRMLKEGNDHFEVTRQEPQVNVCERRYVFNADPAQRLSFSPAAQCPASETPDSIVAAVGAKQRRDASRIAELIKRGTPTAPVRTYADGGMHPVFAEAVERRRAGGYSLASVPGTIPNHVQPPRPRAGATSAPAASSPTALTYADAGAGDVATGTAPNLFNNLFSGSDSSAQQSRTAASSGGDSSGGGNALSRVASWMGLRGSAETQRPAPPTPAAVSRTRREPARATTPRPQRTATPTPVPVREASAAPAWPEPRPEARPPETGSNPQAGTEERRDPAATEPQRQNAPGATMAGAAPTIPAGSFDNRWVSFR